MIIQIRHYNIIYSLEKCIVTNMLRNVMIGTTDIDRGDVPLSFKISADVYHVSH